MDTVLHVTNLVDNRRPAIDGQRLDARRATGVTLQILGHLHAQFAGRAEDQGLGDSAFDVKQLDDGHTKGGGLAGAGLRQADQVVVSLKQEGDGLRLHGGGASESKKVKGVADILTDTKGTK